jgi:plasmid stabilization system protein ParE
MKLRLTPRAARDLADIGDYLWDRSPGAALRVRDTILQSLQNLSLFPELGRKQEEEGVRKIVTRQYSYRVYYITDEATDEIIVVAIRHGPNTPTPDSGRRPGKKLPGHYGQQDLSAGSTCPR